MRLIRLHLQGFKSFKDKTTIHFDDGITGIVGPNGCGKSNIVDALFWVMGEQSAKHLRGNKMKDLIFAGSSKYSPGAFAEVTLVLLNDTGKHIHIGNEVVKPTEIALTRKLYKNGETEYRINNQPARLKDIQEVFMDTGAGAKSYSIIAQGEINRLVQAKPEERRTIIEEVAGITKFKMRKRDSLKKIESTQTNLNRLSDLQTEIYKNLKKLEDQAEKAEKAKRLEERIKHHGLIVKSHKEYELITNFISSNERLINTEKSIEENKARKEELDLALEDERVEKSELMTKVEDEQTVFNEQKTELAKKQERLKYLESSLTEKQNSIESKQNDIEEIAQERSEREELLASLKLKLEEFENKNFDQDEFTLLEEKVENLAESLNEKEEALTDKQNVLTELKEEWEEVEKIIYRNTSKVADFSKQLEDIFTEIEELEKETADKTDAFVSLRDEVSNLFDSVETTTNELVTLKEELAVKKEEFNLAEKELRENKNEKLRVQTRLDSLKELGFDDDGPGKNAEQFLSTEQSEDFRLMADIIGSTEGYEKAIERMLEHTFDSLISSSNEEKLTSWFSSQESKSINYIKVLEEEGVALEDIIERLQLFGCNEICSIQDVVEIKDHQFKDKIGKMLKGHFVAKIDDPSLLWKINPEINFKSIVSQDGAFLVKKEAGIISVQLRDPNASKMGVVERNNLITDLEQKTANLDIVIEEQETRVSELSETVSSLKNKSSEMEAKLNELKLNYASKNSELKTSEQGHNTNTTRLNLLKSRKTDISKEKLELIESEEELNSKRDILEEKKSTLEADVELLNEEITELKNTYDETRSELFELRAQKESFSSQLEGLKSQIHDNETQLAKYATRIESNQIIIENSQAEIETLESEIQNLAQENETTAEELETKKVALEDLKDQLQDLLTSMDGREKEAQKLANNINNEEKSIIELKLKIEQIILDEEQTIKECFEKHSINLRKSIAAYLELSDEQLEDLSSTESIYLVEQDGESFVADEIEYTFDKKFPAVVRESKDKFKRYKSDLNRLGQINWQAIEDYDRQKLRHEFLKEQEEELKKSLIDLETAINHIDEKSKVRFKEAFDEVNMRFTKVFPIIFGGGEARLEVVGDLNDVMCGIDIIAKPPGKKMQSINLMSGGEKAMTAVSLIFSIFLVKPSPFCLLDEVDAPLDDANVGRFNELLREMSSESQFILITHNKKTMELNDTLYGVTMQEPGVSQAVSVQLH